MRNEYIIDWPLLKKWTNESHHSGIRLVFFILWCVLLTGSLVFSVISIVANMYANAFYFILIALFSFYRAFLWNVMIAKQQYKRFAQTYGKNSWVRTISFEENGITNFLRSEVTYVADNLISLSDEDTEKVMNLISTLEDIDDVSSVYHNLDI